MLKEFEGTKFQKELANYNRSSTAFGKPEK